MYSFCVKTLFIFVNLCTIKVDIFINGGKNMPGSNNRMT